MMIALGVVLTPEVAIIPARPAPAPDFDSRRSMPGSGPSRACLTTVASSFASGSAAPNDTSWSRWSRRRAARCPGSQVTA